MKNAEFAQAATRIAKVSADWASDILDTNLGQRPPDVAVGRFIADIRQRLDWLEEKHKGQRDA